MTEIKISKVERLTYKVKKAVPKLLVLAAILGVIAYLGNDIYSKSEALTFAFTNPKQVVEAKESYNQEIEKAQNQYRENLSRSFISPIQ